MRKKINKYDKPRLETGLDIWGEIGQMKWLLEMKWNKKM